MTAKPHKALRPSVVEAPPPPSCFLSPLFKSCLDLESGKWRIHISKCSGVQNYYAIQQQNQHVHGEWYTAQRRRKEWSQTSAQDTANTSDKQIRGKCRQFVKQTPVGGCRTIAKFTLRGRKVSLSLVRTHVCTNAGHSDTVISSSSKSAELWLFWVTAVGARETLWFIPARVISLVVNIGNSCIPKQWPPTSCPSEWTRRRGAHIFRSESGHFLLNTLCTVY